MTDLEEGKVAAGVEWGDYQVQAPGGGAVVVVARARPRPCVLAQNHGGPNLVAGQSLPGGGLEGHLVEGP